MSNRCPVFTDLRSTGATPKKKHSQSSHINFSIRSRALTCSSTHNTIINPVVPAGYAGTNHACFLQPLFSILEFSVPSSFNLVLQCCVRCHPNRKFLDSTTVSSLVLWLLAFVPSCSDSFPWEHQKSAFSQSYTAVLCPSCSVASLSTHFVAELYSLSDSASLLASSDFYDSAASTTRYFPARSTASWIRRICSKLPRFLQLFSW